MDESLASKVFVVHMTTNALEEHVLQLLKQRYADMLPWFCSQVGAKVTIRPGCHGNSFTLVATWDGGTYSKYYGGEMARALGRRGCARRLAELFVDEVRKHRGEETDDE